MEKHVTKVKKRVVRQRVLSGDRATGKIHIGILFGALTNWVKLQETHECFYEIADLHALTTSYNHTEGMKERVREMAANWIACGISPEKSTIFVQSRVLEHTELHLLFSMITPVSWLERNPTLKEQVKDLKLQGKINYGLLGYPVLQAADILAYKADAVPVGEDQLAHVELTRQIARRFNSIYGHVFPEPISLLTKFPKIPGIDGRKMSKSLNNAILVDEKLEGIREKVMRAFTDPTKIHKEDVGHPNGCVVFAYHKLINSQKSEEIRKDCIKGKIGCVSCKEEAIKLINKTLAPYREQCVKLKDKNIDEILKEGSIRAKKEAGKTLKEVKEVMNLW
ncbi:tryptophan--tRNA ligase [candidate division WOR-3 bacterium]|nr:tryptophan--tRNA ligase [candidate division WOR-3 bacterium]